MMPYRLDDLTVRDRLRAAEMHYSRGMYSLARESYAALLDGSCPLDPPAEAELAWRLAQCCVILGRNDEAVAVLDRARELSGLPEVYAARFESVRGFAELSRGRYDAARELRF